MRGGAVKEIPASSVSRGGSSHHSGALLVMGLIFIAFFVLGLMTQVQTNEAFINHATNVDSYRPNWWVFVQPIGLFLGWYNPDVQEAVFFGWFIEILYLGITFVGLEIVHHMAHQAGRLLGILFEVIAFAAVCFNWYTDFNYGTMLTSGDWGHFWFACVTAITVGYFGRFGLFLIKLGWNRA